MRRLTRRATLRRTHSLSSSESLERRSSTATAFPVDDAVKIDEERRNAQYQRGSPRRRLLYVIVGVALVLYAASWVVLASLYESNVYFFTYYAVDYENGFVRRGLAGEILNLFPADFYFTGQLILRWLVPGIFLVGLSAVAWAVGFRHGRSERRLMLALLIPVLPFGFAGAVVNAQPNLVGEAALAGFAVAVAVLNTERSILAASAIYGFTIAMLTFVHEATPLLVSFGAILAIVILTHHRIAIQRLSALLATAPGMVAALVVGLVGRRDVSSQCVDLPRKVMDWPVDVSQGQALGQKINVDFHDFTCNNIIPLFDQAPEDGLKSLARLGGAPWIGSVVVGIAICATTIFTISAISGVPFKRFRDLASNRPLWVIAGILVLLPVFATSQDWVRWWVAISFDVGVVYLLYASRQAESAQPADRRIRLLFGMAIILLSALPIGTISQVGTNPQLKT